MNTPRRRREPPIEVPYILGLAASAEGLAIHLYWPWQATHQLLLSTPSSDTTELHGFGAASEAAAEHAWQAAQINAPTGWWDLTTQDAR